MQIDHANESPEDKDIAIPYQRRVLLKALLRTMALASYAPTSGTATRPEVLSQLKQRCCLFLLFSLS